MTKKAKKVVDWHAVESAMRRSINGRASERDGELCMAAYKADSKHYGELHRRVKAEEIEAYKRQFDGRGGAS